MIKKLSTYIIIFIIAVIIGFIFAITFKNIIKVYSKVKENNKKINFLANINNNKTIPSLCFQSAFELAQKTNTLLPTITPLGTIPLKSKDNSIDFDRFGFRNNDEVWENYNHDFLIIGDSVVVDNNIPDVNIFSNNFKNKSSINLGCGGNGLLSNLHLIEQIAQTNYNFNNILFFVNFDNDFSKDTLREYHTQLFSQISYLKSKNLFLNEKKYKMDYLRFVNTSFSKQINNFSFKDELFNEFKIDKYLKNDFKFNTREKIKKVLLEDGRTVDSKTIPEGAYSTEMYNLFLKILERIVYLKQKYNINVSLVLVPTNKEIDIYNSKLENDIEWDRYINYKYLKNTIASTAANFNINIIDLYDFIKENNYKGFTEGHFEKEFHPLLSNYIIKNINMNTNIHLQKIYYYNSFYPSKKFFNYQVNFGNTLSSEQLKNWINIINKLMQKNVIDNYLLTPALGYLFINQKCDYILELNKISNNNLINYSVGDFFYKVCNLKYTGNINKSIKEINFLISNDLQYYVPGISSEVKKSLGLINENK